MHRTLRDSATLLRHHGLTRWSLLLLPALLLALTAPLQPEGAGMEAVRFLGFGLALVPLARMISILVDELSEHLGDRYSGVVSVGLSNLVELVISITALGSGLYSLVVVSVAGAVITNCLLVLGVSTIWAGRRQKTVGGHQRPRSLCRLFPDRGAADPGLLPAVLPAPARHPSHLLQC